MNGFGEKLFFDELCLIKWKIFLYILYFQGKSALWSHLIQFQDREEKQEHLAESPGEFVNLMVSAEVVALDHVRNQYCVVLSLPLSLKLKHTPSCQ